MRTFKRRTTTLRTLIVPFSAFFYGFFVFDIYGDAVGYKKALWAPALLVVWPLILLLSSKLCKVPQVDETVNESQITEVLSVNNVLYSIKSNSIELT